MNGPTARFNACARWIVVILLVGFAVPAMAQNTKGERPVDNQRQIRATKSKSVKRKDKSKTRDIAGRRLRTKNKSSANSANVGIRQPDPYAKRPRIHTDRAAKPRQRTYAESPSERPRAPRGDISGHRLRTTRPRESDAAGANVYPEQRQFSRYVNRKPTGDQSPRVYNKTASGKSVVRRLPQQKERAWKGDMKGQRFNQPRSVSAQRNNTFPQGNEYSQYVRRKVPTDRAVSNQREVNRTARMTKPPRTKAGGAVYPASATKSFIKRGRKNVYWGKFSKGEKPYTRDLTGAPLRQKNYRSPAVGLVGRDTLAHFGRKPGGDVSFAGRQREYGGAPSRKSGWRGDISGHRLRQGKPSGRQIAGQNVFPRKLSGTKGGETTSRPLPSAPVSSRRKGEKAGQPIPGKGPGMGGKAVADALNRTKGRPVKGFSGQGEGFSGTLRRGQSGIPSGAERVSTYKGNQRSGQGKTFESQGEGFSGTIRRGQMGIPSGAERVSAYRGNLRSGQGKTFESQGEGFSGYIKAKKPFKGGGSISGRLWNNGQTAISKRGIPSAGQRVGSYSGNIRGQQKTFENQGEGFSGYIKAKKPLKGGGSISGHWNNRNMPIDQKGLPAGAGKAGSFSGHLRAGQGKTFESQGENFSGYIKAKKPLKGGGSVSAQPRNNYGEPVERRVLPQGWDKPGTFSGNLRAGQGKTFESQGENFSGYIKAKKPLKGGGSVSAQPRNNYGEPVERKVLPQGWDKPVAFSGNLRSKGKAKGGGSVSGELWNNDEEPITTLDRSGAALQASVFKGKTKYRPSKPGTAGFDDNGKIRMKQDFTQSPNAVDESTKKHKPGRERFEVEGLQVRVERQKYSNREHSASGALRGIGPTRSTVRASQYSSGTRVTADHRHNPNSADEALKGTYYGGRSTAQMGSFHGNVRVKKTGSDRRMHPDAKFAHNAGNNVKDERTILTNVKLFWTKLFHKSESQPSAVRQKERRPRYDKREIGMWAE